MLLLIALTRILSGRSSTTLTLALRPVNVFHGLDPTLLRDEMCYLAGRWRSSVSRTNAESEKPMYGM